MVMISARVESGAVTGPPNLPAACAGTDEASIDRAESAAVGWVTGVGGHATSGINEQLLAIGYWQIG